MRFAASIWVAFLWTKYGESTLSLPMNDLSILKENKNLSSGCWQQIENLDPLTLLTMFDASTKIPSGILQGNFFDLGNYDECLGINFDSAVGPIYGKYCLGTISMIVPIDGKVNLNKTVGPKNFAVQPEPRILGGAEDSVGLHYAICVPHSCSAEEISSLSTYREDFCYSRHNAEGYSAGFYVTVAIISLFLFIVVVSTIYDVVLEYRQHRTKHELLVAFSVLSNGRKLFTSSTNPDQLLCLNGIKAISMMWVILGHTYNSAVNSPLSNVLDAAEFQHDAGNMFLLNAYLSVDTFFVIGGLVMVYTFLKSHDKGVKLNIPLFYFHRYLRLTPALAVVMLIHLYVAKYLADGPLAGGVDITLAQPCREGWWGTIFYIQNYQGGSCVAQSWYLSVDMQVFILTPLILLPLVKWPRHTLSALGLLAILGVVVPFTVAYVHNLNPNDTTQTKKYFRLYYKQTYARFGPYVIGMILGYYLYKFKKDGTMPRLNSVVVLLLWMVGLGGLLACLYATYETDQTRLSNSFQLGFQKPAWAVALSIIIYLCVTSHGKLVDWFLSAPIFQFLTKLSYSMYLTHIFIINVKSASMKTSFRFSNIEMMMTFWGYFMYTAAVSFVLCVTFESPIIILEKYLFGRGGKKESKKKLEI